MRQRVAACCSSTGSHAAGVSTGPGSRARSCGSSSTQSKRGGWSGRSSVAAVAVDSFGARSQLSVGSATYSIVRLDKVVDDPRRLPYATRILLENLLRREDGVNVTADD